MAKVEMLRPTIASLAPAKREAFSVKKFLTAPLRQFYMFRRPSIRPVSAADMVIKARQKLGLITAVQEPSLRDLQSRRGHEGYDQARVRELETAIIENKRQLLKEINDTLSRISLRLGNLTLSGAGAKKNTSEIDNLKAAQAELRAIKKKL